MTNHMTSDHALRMPGTATAMLMPWRPLAPEPPAHRSRSKRSPLSRPIAHPTTIKELSA
jgi:hypothetical protein